MKKNDDIKREIVSLMKKIDFLVENGISSDNEELLSLSRELDLLIVAWVKGSNILSD